VIEEATPAPPAEPTADGKGDGVVTPTAPAPPPPPPAACLLVGPG
jgi:hypothetical protein